jgi:hypothetical protein
MSLTHLIRADPRLSLKKSLSSHEVRRLENFCRQHLRDVNHLSSAVTETFKTFKNDHLSVKYRKAVKTLTNNGVPVAHILALPNNGPAWPFKR